MKIWAEKEIEAAIAHEKKMANNDPDEYNYGVTCYESALAAYKAMTEDGHSGFSWSITAGILRRLLANKPLTPITEENADWYHEDWMRPGEYQSKRYGSLFKHITANGTTYSDTERCYGTTPEKPDISWGGGGIYKYVDELLPITLPYTPTVESINVIRDDYLLDENNGDYDHVGYLYMIVPGGTVLSSNPKKKAPHAMRIPINKYFKEHGDNLVPITKEEYFEDRKKVVPAKDPIDILMEEY